MGEGGSVRERRRIPRNLSLLYVFVFPPSINGDVKAPNRKVFRFIELLTRFFKKKKVKPTFIQKAAPGNATEVVAAFATDTLEAAPQSCRKHHISGQRACHEFLFLGA